MLFAVAERPLCCQPEPKRGSGATKRSVRPAAHRKTAFTTGNRRIIMTPNPVLLFVWAALAICFLGLLLYRGQITRYEDEQLFLNEDCNKVEQEQQTRIVQRVKRLEPLVRIFGGAAGLVTAGVVGMYVYDAWLRLQ
jgi:hypothetical protein